MKPIKSILMLVVVLALVAVQSMAIADDDPLRHYKEIWDAQRPKLNSGIIRYKEWKDLSYEIKDHNTVRVLFQKVADSNRKDYPAIACEFEYKISGTTLTPNPDNIPDRTLYFNGKRLRNESEITIDIFDGDNIIRTRHIGNEQTFQIAISQRKPDVEDRHGLRDVYYVPDLELVNSLAVASSTRDRDCFEEKQTNHSPNDPITMNVAKNGDVLEVRTGDVSKGLCVETIRLAFKDFGGVRLPQLIFNGVYRDGQLTSATVTAILDADFTTKIDDSVFVQDAKAGDIIFDTRNDHLTTNQVKDVIEDVTKAMKPAK